MGTGELKKEMSKTNKLLKELIIVTNKTKRTLTMVNVINTITLIVIVALMFRGLI